MLAVKYREVVEKQHEVLQTAAAKISNIAHILMAIVIVGILVLGGIGLATCFQMNEDSNDLMTSYGSTYYERFLKYKDAFAMSSVENYQPQWMMSGLGYYVSVVLYPSREGQRPVKPDDISGLETLNRFFDLVENFTSSDEKKFPELCAKHKALSRDQCYRMNISEIAREENRRGKNSLYRYMTAARGPITPYFVVEVPSQKAYLGSEIYMASTAEIFGSSLRGDQGLDIIDCEKDVSDSGVMFNSTCVYLGEESLRVEALRYAWHLRYDTEEEKEMSHRWISEVAENCQQFAKLANEENDEDNQWNFMCYTSMSFSDGAKVAIKGDLKWILLALLFSLAFPVLLIIKPCGANNFSMLILIAVGLFFLTLIGAIGIGSLLGFQLCFSFIVTMLFLVWFFVRVCLHIVESLKDYLAQQQQHKRVTQQEEFGWLLGHWVPVLLANLSIVSITSFLVCTSMYKIIWYTSGFFGVFFLVSAVSIILVFFCVIALVLKSRNSDGRPCCMGKEVDDADDEKTSAAFDNSVVQGLKLLYVQNIIQGSKICHIVIIVIFTALFVGCVIFGAMLFTVEETDENYYGYDRSEMVPADDNAIHMLEVLKKYYPNNGPLVQLIFNDKAKYYANSTACEGQSACTFHLGLLYNELLPALWNGPESAWKKWSLSFYKSVVMNLLPEGEKVFETQEDVENNFALSRFRGIPLYALFNDLARLHVDELEDPYSPRMEGDPFTRMYVRQKYLSNTAQEIKYVKELELAQKKLGEQSSAELKYYFPADSYEIYSNLFLMYDNSRDILSRSFLLPAAIAGCLIFTLLCAFVSIPHPFAHLVIYINGLMLFFEFFAIQNLFGTTINNFSMPYYFLIFIFAVEYTLYPVHINLKYLLMHKSAAVGPPAPSPVPSVVILMVALLSFLIMIIVPLSSLVAVAIRNCIFVFGVIGPLHELLFIPAVLKLLLIRTDDSDDSSTDAAKHDKAAASYNAKNGVELQEKAKAEEA